MPLYCNIFSCKNFAGVSKGSGEECRFFRTPCDTEKRDKWIKEIQKYQKTDQRMVICQRHFEPKYLHVHKNGIRLSKDAVPTIFDAKPLSLPTIQPTTSSNDEAMIPEISMDCDENLEFIPPMQPLPNNCDRCVQQEVKIRAQEKLIAQLQTTCDERLCIILSLQNEIKKLKEPNENEPNENEPNENEPNEPNEPNENEPNEPNEPEIISRLTEQQTEQTLPMQQKKTAKKPNFLCHICKTEFSTKREAQRHVDKNHKSNCFVCKQKVGSLKLDAHICTGLESLNCTYCQHECSSTKCLLEHLNSCEKGVKFAYKCDCCRDYFLMESLLSIHIKCHEVNKNEFVCHVCHKSYATKESLRAHKKRHDEAVGGYLCDVCGKGPFRSRLYLTRHKYTHDNKEIKCHKCDKTFTNKLTLGSHIRNLHRDLKRICNICGAEMRTLGALYIHKKTHTRTEADRKHACNLCPLKFFQAHRLQQHIREKHLAKERYDCEFCKQSYKYKSDLNRHRRQHLGEDMYACPTCPKRFRYAYELERHSFEHYAAPAADDNKDQMETT